MPAPLPTYKEIPLSLKDYTFDCPVGVWRARLDGKAWGTRRNILLYFFRVETNTAHCISVFNETYHSAEDRRIDFRYSGQPGQVFELETAKTRTGRTRFLAARLVTGPEQEAPAEAAPEALTRAS